MEAPKLVTYEVWEDVEPDGAVGTTMSTPGNITKLLEQGVLADDARKTDVIQAATYEEAMSIWNLRRGFEPYKPEGEAAECPNKCGMWYWPMNSGQCPRCGKLG